jgi:hypothetical protein
MFQTKTQEPELRESTTKYNKMQIYQWEQKTKYEKHSGVTTQLCRAPRRSYGFQATLEFWQRSLTNPDMERTEVKKAVV